jgi:hypothetical protein
MRLRLQPYPTRNYLILHRLCGAIGSGAPKILPWKNGQPLIQARGIMGYTKQGHNLVTNKSIVLWTGMPALDDSGLNQTTTRHKFDRD